MALSEEEFVTQLVNANVDPDIAHLVFEEAAFYYFEPLRPDPSDRWESTMQADPEDLEDITAKFWKLQEWPEPPRTDPVLIPQDPSLLEFAQWLQSHRLLRS